MKCSKIKDIKLENGFFTAYIRSNKDLNTLYSYKMTYDKDYSYEENLKNFKDYINKYWLVEKYELDKNK